jgi:hypothetical protein
VVLAPDSGTFVILLQEHKAHEGAGSVSTVPVLIICRSVEDLGASRSGVSLRRARRGPSGAASEQFGAVLIFRDPDRIQLEPSSILA